MAKPNIMEFMLKNYKLIMLAAAACILAAIVYRAIYNPHELYAVQESFQQSGTIGGQAIQDLLDKLNVDIYGKESVWSNQLFRQQPNIGERPLSIWRPLNETGEPYRLLGHTIGDREDYDMPRKNTMLVQGDTKIPIDASKVFDFPHNQLTKPPGNSQVTAKVYKGLRNLEEINKRRQQLQSGLANMEDTLGRVKAAVKATMEEVGRRNMQNSVRLYGPDGFFQAATATVNLDDRQRSVSFPNGDYNSMRIPVGSQIMLQSQGGGTMDIKIPLDTILDQNGNYLNNGEGPSIEQFYRYIDGISQHDFRVSGKYCLRARDFFGEERNSPLNNRNNSTVNRSNAKDPNKVFMPFYRRSKSTDLNYTYNYRVGPDTYPNNRNGRADIYKYLTSDEYSNANAAGSRGIGRVGVDKIGYNLIGSGKQSVLELNNNSSKKMRDALLYRERDTVEMDRTGIESLIEQLETAMSENWIQGDDSLLEVKKLLDTVASQTTVPIDKYYVDLAFTFRTWHRYMKQNKGFGTRISYGKYADSRGEEPDTLEMLYRSGSPNFYGRMTGGSISMIDSRDVVSPEIRQVQTISDMLNEASDRLIASYRFMLDSLDTAQRAVESGQLMHFPLQIWRPKAPVGYTCLGDVAFNHNDINFDKRQPQLDNIACVPSQCVKAIRDWLPVDKIYEYRDTTQGGNGAYLAVYRNPYLQTFRVSTQPGILPTGKVEKVVACVERCRVLDDIIEADKCAQEFYKANKRAVESHNLDGDNVIQNREGHIYRSRIREREDRINTLREVARRLQIQDDKAHIVNQEFNRQKFQKLVDDQRHNINSLANRLDQQAHTVDVRVHFDYDKFQRLLYALRESERIPDSLHDRLQDMVGDALVQQQSSTDQTSDNENGSDLDDGFVRQLLGECPTPESQGLVLKSLVEAGCYNCANLV